MNEQLLRHLGRAFERAPGGYLLIAIDTSGSIDDQIFAQYSALIADIHRLLAVPLRIVMCDCRVLSDIRVGAYEELPQLTLMGVAGTDFRPVFDMINAEDEKPTCIAYLTDGFGVFPKQPPGVATAWVIPQKTAIPWGDIFILETEERA